MRRHSEHWRIHKPAVVSAGGVVAAQHWLAAKAGAEFLAAGGNAVDAAVATAFALNAVEPWMSGLGGNGYLVVYLAQEQRAQVVNFQGATAARIDPDHYPLDPAVPMSIMGFPGVVGNRNVTGYGAIALPGAVEGLSQALARFGTLAFDRVLTPAIDLAEQGLPVDWHATLQIALQMHELRKDPGASAIYLPDGCPPQPETDLPLGHLARTLRRLAEHGPRDFYEGEIAELMVADLRAGGSAIDLADLAGYRAFIGDCQSGVYRGARIYGADATSGAPRLLAALAQLQAELRPGSRIDADTYHCYARALDAAFAQHQQRMGARIESGCTTHISAVDSTGNLVALTYTLLNRFGAQVVLPRTGILMNNAIAYFDPRPGRPTSLAGGKRINSSNMCPAIALRTDDTGFAIGASGANFIVPAVTQVMALLLDYGLSLEEAFHTPRIDASNRGGIRADAALPAAILEPLGQTFTLEIAQSKVYPKLYANPSGVMHDSATGLNHGMTDPNTPVAAAWAAD